MNGGVAMPNHITNVLYLQGDEEETEEMGGMNL